MKIKIISYIIEQMMSEEIFLRADVCLPKKLLAMSLVFDFMGLGIMIYSIFSSHSKVVLFFVGIVFIILGILAFLCYKNQMIQVISEEEFEYSTFLGKKTIYRFDQIKGLRKNSDSYTLFVADSKVHIEMMAIMSERFVDLINKSLEKK